MNAFDRVMAARAKGRATGLDYIRHIFTDFFELHGDRCSADDKAVIAGIARIKDIPVTIIALEMDMTPKKK